MTQQALEHISRYAARGDTELRALNKAIKDLVSDQYVKIDIQRFRDGHWVDVFYQNVPPLELRSASFSNDATFLNSDLPDDWEAVFNVPIDPTSITDSSAVWVDSGATTHTVDKVDITLSEGNRKLDVPLPTLAGTFEGSTFLTIKNLKNENGDVAGPISVRIEVVGADTAVPRTGSEPYTAAIRSGESRAARLIVGDGLDHRALLKDYLRTADIRDKDVIDVVKVSNTDGRVTEIFLFWYVDRTPRLVSVSPRPGSSIPSMASGSGLVLLSFDEPVDVPTLEGGGRVFINGTDVVASGDYDLTKRDDEGSLWSIEGDPLKDAGQKVLTLKDIPNASGDGGDNYFLFGWQVLPLVFAGATPELLDMNWEFSTTTTDSDPGLGKFRFNNVSPGVATFIYIDDINSAGRDMGPLVSGLLSGDKIYIQDLSTPGNSFLFDVTGVPTDGTGYWKIPVSADDAGGTPSNEQECGFLFFPINVPTGGDVTLEDAREDVEGLVAVSTGATDGLTLKLPRAIQYDNHMDFDTTVANARVARGIHQITTGGGGSTTNVTNSRNGVISLATNSSLGDAIGFNFSSQATAQSVVDPNEPFLFEAWVSFPNTLPSAYVCVAGFVNANFADLAGTFSAAADGIFFNIESGVNSSQWQGVCMNSGTATSENSSITATSTWRRLQIVNDGGTNISFYIDDALVGSTVTTNIPTINLIPVIWLGTATSSAFTIHVDRVYMVHESANV